MPPFFQKEARECFLHTFSVGLVACRPSPSAWAGYSTGEKEAVRVMSSLTVRLREVLVLPSDQEMN